MELLKQKFENQVQLVLQKVPAYLTVRSPMHIPLFFVPYSSKGRKLWVETLLEKMKHSKMEPSKTENRDFLVFYQTYNMRMQNTVRKTNFLSSNLTKNQNLDEENEARMQVRFFGEVWVWLSENVKKKRLFGNCWPLKIQCEKTKSTFRSSNQSLQLKEC